MEKALRYNKNKVEWGLVDWKSLEPMVRVLMYGAEKYEIDNWKKGQDLKSLSSCLMRHLVAFMDGEDNDPESGESHLGHILCNAMFMIHSQANHLWTDNRDLSEDAAYLEECRLAREQQLARDIEKATADLEQFREYYDYLDKAAEDNEAEAIVKKQKGLPFQEFNDLDDSFRYGG